MQDKLSSQMEDKTKENVQYNDAIMMEVGISNTE